MLNTTLDGAAQSGRRAFHHQSRLLTRNSSTAWRLTAEPHPRVPGRGRWQAPSA